MMPAANRRLWSTPNRQPTTGHEPGDDGIPRILLLTDALDGAIEGAKHATPDAEVSAEDGGARLDGGEGAGKTFATGRVAGTLMPCQIVPPTAPMAKAPQSR